MITASDIKDYLKLHISGVNSWFSGSMRDNGEKCICVYSKESMGLNTISMGGKENTSTFNQGYAILVHWNKNAKESELKAMEVYDRLWGENPTINNHEVVRFSMRNSNPVGVGTDDNGIYEFVINFDCLYKRGE
ncbi:MAG: minor capsid protein [Peptostreptococcus porci]|uniref:phage tail terminator protein n=1 Tax=Peptostreptococcus porci TaxID=2652282 RepID=UPI002A91A741|nr:minor capsid protein [Peptostreptococcus porci]MDY5480181.1 minor capsid protein [Peptostreptococcus porci]